MKTVVTDNKYWLRLEGYQVSTVIPAIDLEAQAPAFAGTRPIEREGRFHNAAYTLEAGRLSDVHLKRYLPDEPGYWEATWYAAGPTSFEIFDVAGARAGVQICTEMWFFEHAREYARAGAQLLLAPRATPHESRDKWLAGGRAAAVSAGAWCLSSNHWIPGGGAIDHGGLGWVVDPDGQVLATTSEDQPFVTVDIDLATADAAKRTYPRYVI
ncbi:carbon-nitrogen hydrolase family protein [Mariniluteicoccus endophyticus]